LVHLSSIRSISGLQECIQMIGRGNRHLGPSNGTVFVQGFSGDIKEELEAIDIELACRVATNIRLLNNKANCPGKLAHYSWYYNAY
jgi:hypothetical protein